MSNQKPDGRLSNKEIEYLLRALRTNVKAAKTAILGLEPKLRADFEDKLNTTYPLQSDPVWEKAFHAVVDQYKMSQAKVEARCDELGIPVRFRPSIQPPGWLRGGFNMVKEFRADMRRVTYMHIKAMVQERVEEQEREAARVQLEILAHGCVTPVAQAFFDQLPNVEDLVKPITAQEAFSLLEGAPLEHINSWERAKLPEYQPDIGKVEEQDDD
jgi:hypothetical protein